jgi:ABC-type multidrug transport system ATPase subunit
MHGLNPVETLDRIAPVIAKLRLAEDIDNYAEDYSRGMKKKLGLLLAMLHQPKLLVLDEPTNGLDVESTHLFYDLIFETAALGTTVLFSTHLMDHVTRLCSHAVIINEGNLAANGSLEELCAESG